MRKQVKIVLVICGAIVFSTIAIQASDIVRNIDGNLASLALHENTVCGEGATLMQLSLGSLCVDVYEASAADTCPFPEPQSEIETQENINHLSCQAFSAPEKMPWRYVSMQQAQQLCARSGKRLPNNDEWYALASGMSDQSGCRTEGSTPIATGQAQCVTHAGIYDIVGNVWEWVDAQVTNGIYNKRPVPNSGYVQLVDGDGVVLETGESGRVDYGDDYANTNSVGVYGMIRGGFYGSGEDAGLYAQNLAVPFDLKAPGVGFRCVRSI